jgi:hypothetical protein
MSHDKAIRSGKERRKPYWGSKACDPTCRNHGGCPWCEGNRAHRDRRRGTGRIQDRMNETETDELNENQ